MADVHITLGGTGLCQYCEEAPADRTVNGQWQACESCAERVALGARDVGYEAYIFESSGWDHVWCSICESYGFCNHRYESFMVEQAELDAKALPVIPPKLQKEAANPDGRATVLTFSTGPCPAPAPDPADPRDPARPP